jgi:hypothetical protein
LRPAARRARGWTQTETARALEPYLGYRLSRAAFSQAESSLIEGHQIRRFDADEIIAFARVFGRTVGSFFSPPEPHYMGKRVIINGKPGNPRAHVTSAPLSREEMVPLAIGSIEVARTEEDRRRQQEIMTALAELYWRPMVQKIGPAVRAHLVENPEALKDTPGRFLADVFDRLTQQTAAEEQRVIEQARASAAKIYPDKPFDQVILGASPSTSFPPNKSLGPKKRGKKK